MKKSLIVFVSAILLNSAAFAQSKDSLTYKKDRKWSFEVLEGCGSTSVLNKGYANRIENNSLGSETSQLGFENYHVHEQSSSGQGKLDYLLLLPTLRMALNYKHNYFLSSFIAMRYYQSKFYVHYRNDYSYNSAMQEGPAYEDYSISASTHNFVLSLGPKVNVKNFFFSASLNVNMVMASESMSGSRFVPHSPYHADYSISYDKSYTAFCPGAGATVGYEFHLKSHVLEVELAGDYLQRKQTLYDDSTVKLHSLNMALLMGFKF